MTPVSPGTAARRPLIARRTATRRGRTLAVLATASLAVTLAACGGGKSAKGTSGNTAKGAGGVLNVSMPDGATEKDNNNPLLETSSAAHLGYRYMMYEPLAMDNQAQPAQAARPWLASKFDWSDNFKTLTLTARDNVKFSDGTAMTADDIAFSFQILKDHKALNAGALPIGTVTATGNQVKVTFTDSQYVRQNKVLRTLVVPKHIWEKIADPTTDPIVNPVGTGPYVLKTFTPQTVTLDLRTDAYWQDKPKVGELRYTTYSGNDTETTALVTGTTEWSYVFMPDAKTLYAGKDPHNKLWFPPNLSADGLWFNTTIKPFDNAALRRAMSMVINRADIFNQGEAGYFKPQVDSITGLPSGAGDSFVIDEYKGKTAAADVATAKKLLTDNGFTYNGSTLVDPAGKPVTITLTDPAAWGDYQTDLSIISDNIGQLGIKATIDKADQDAWFNAIANGNFQAAMHWSNGGATPYDMYENIMNGANLVPIGQPANSGNYGRYNNPDATKALADYANGADDATRQAALAKLEKIMVEDVPMIPTSAGNVGAEYSTKNWIGWPDDSNPYAAAQPTQTTALDVVLHLKPAS
jgi:peptide/nickel transport system substrate-binding protein